MTLILREAPAGDALDELVAFCYGEIDDEKNRKDLAQINDCMFRFKSAVTRQIIKQLRHRTAAAQTDYITNASNSLAVLKDVIFSRYKINERQGKCTGRFRALYSGVHTIQQKVMKSWPAHCCKEHIKVDDREMAFAKEGLHTSRRHFTQSLKWYVTEQQLIDLALQPLKAILNGGTQGIMIAELERVQQYVAMLENVLPKVPAKGAGSIVTPRKYVDNQLLKFLKASGYFTADQLPQPEEDNAEEEIPVDEKTKRRTRLMLEYTMAFFAGMLRTFREQGYVMNGNMAELRRFFAWFIHTPTADGTTEGALEDAYKKINDHTRKSLILFFENCIRWLKNYKG